MPSRQTAHGPFGLAVEHSPINGGERGGRRAISRRPRSKKESASVGLTRVAGEGILLPSVPPLAHGLETPKPVFAHGVLTVCPSPSEGEDSGERVRG